MKTATTLLAILVAFAAYSIIGTEYNVPIIEKMAPQAMSERGWKILRYEGYLRGAWQQMGGACYYHVANTDNPSIQYRVSVSLWKGKLMWWYGAPESLSRFQVEVKN